VAKKNIRRSYDLPPELVERLNELSEELEIPQGHLIALFSFQGLDRLESGEITLEEFLEPHINSLKYRYKLNLSRFLKNSSDDDK
jgi:hypothetical protein